MGRRVAITGLGVVSPIGNSTEEMWESIQHAVCGIAPITHYDTEGRKVKLAGEVKDIDFTEVLSSGEIRKMDRGTAMALYAAQEAWDKSGLEGMEESHDRWGVILSSGIGGIETIEKEHSRGLEKGFDRVSPFFIPMAISNMPAGHIAIRFDLHGMTSCAVTACASAANGIGDAFRNIRDGYSDVMLAGGCEASITPLSIGGFTAMKALSKSEDPTRASIPFDAERSGFVMGEGAAVLVLEEYEHAVNRGAKIYGEMVGYAANCDAHHITTPDPEGTWAAKCMQLALEDAGITTADVDYINAHGTSTKMNDAGETKAVRLVFGEDADRLRVSSTKSMTGHLLGASAAVEAVITVKALEEQFVPPTIGYKTPDPDCDLNIVPNEGYAHEMRYALSNSFGFGGHNATLVFKA